ncbi:hypothetical protein CKAH01_06016 [Colletotrichum kahawae]|uniref:Uncharacterized protein n=1 Tax=Colletotrichum kahawae TaxID=34407 RepID=A0AAD9YCZ3_COLKA|nr:hypothetical protein CKAH01_06016 [Colletotrichum kahawae]
MTCPEYYARPKSVSRRGRDRDGVEVQESGGEGAMVKTRTGLWFIPAFGEAARSAGVGASFKKGRDAGVSNGRNGGRRGGVRMHLACREADVAEQGRRAVESRGSSEEKKGGRFRERSEGGEEDR